MSRSTGGAPETYPKWPADEGGSCFPAPPPDRERPGLSEDLEGGASWLRGYTATWRSGGLERLYHNKDCVHLEDVHLFTPQISQSIESIFD